MQDARHPSPRIIRTLALKRSACEAIQIIYLQPMSTVQEIEAAISKLNESELAEIRSWIWERDIERDAASGKLDFVAEEALQEHRDGKTRRL